MRPGVLLALVLASIVSAAPANQPSPLILISLDGFRWDYCDLFPAESPTLRQLRREGVSTRALIPAFPSNTFPNHYTIVTGLYPAHHGIVNNDFFDAESGRFFHAFQPASAREPQWWRGEPIWVTAIRQGRKAASSFWVGSETAIGGTRPTFWKPYDYSVPFEQRLDELLGWLRLPAAQRPAVVTFYLEETNSAGHRFGPASPEVVAAIKLCDQRVAAILAGVRQAGLKPNLMVVSDHGMTAISLQHTIALDDVVPLDSVQIDADGTVMGLRPLKGDVAALFDVFKKVPHLRVLRAEDLPPRLHLPAGPRVSPLWLLPDEGWHIGTRAAIERLRVRFHEKGYLAGDHGYDPALPSMRGIFFAHGPAFRTATELPELENIHLYNLMCAVLKLTPAKNDGDDRLVRTALRE
jgi:predicted AlkP superfamily pyrophosphatase or phosphodiesterase